MTDSRRNKILQIVKYATLLNDEPTERALTENKPTVFYKFSGHVGLFDVEIHNTGWVRKSDADVSFSVEFTKEWSEIKKYGKRLSYPTDVVLNIALNCIKALYKEWSDKPCKITE